MTIKNLVLYELLKTLILVLIRRRTLLLFTLILSIPIAVSTACLLIPHSLEEESSQLVKMLGEKESLIIIAWPNNNNRGNNVSLVCMGKIIVKNDEIEIPILFIRRNTFIREIKHWPTHEHNQYKRDIRVSISNFLKNKLDLTWGSEIKICITTHCIKHKIDFIHEDRGIYASSIILIVPKDRDLNMYKCPYKLVVLKDSPQISSILNQLTSFISMITHYFAIVILFIYFPIVFLGYKKIVNTIRDDVLILYEIGLSSSYIKIALGIVLLFLGIIMILYGVSLGIFTLHLSIWALRFANIILEARPILTLRDLCYITTPYLAWIALTVAILLRRGIESLE